MNRSPLSRQAVVTHNCGERGEASLALRARRGNGRFVRIPPALPLTPAAAYQELRISRQVDLARLVLATAEFG